MYYEYRIFWLEDFMETRNVVHEMCIKIFEE